MFPPQLVGENVGWITRVIYAEFQEVQRRLDFVRPCKPALANAKEDVL
jgi:hypothetical protein